MAKTQMAKNSNPVDLVEFSNAHLDYEIGMFLATANELQSKNHPTHIKNALLESFLIHLRSLIYFLFCTKKREDDVCAQDYVEEANCKNWNKGVPEELNELSNRVSKEIAHLTTMRQTTASSKEWNTLEIVTTMRGYLAKFFEQADPSKLNARISP